MKTKLNLTLSGLALALALFGALSATAAESGAGSEDSNAAMVQQGKDAGATAVSANQSGKVDETGKSTGETQTTSEQSQQDDLKSFQNMTGTQSAEMSSSPAEAGGTATATVRTENKFQFNCRLARPGSLYGAGSVSFRLNQCQLVAPNSGTVTTAQFSMCDKAQRADVCSKPADYNKVVDLVNGHFTAHALGQVGLGCNSTAQCEVTFQGVTTTGGNDATLRADAETTTQNSEVASSFQETAKSQEYADTKAETQGRLANCAGTAEDGEECQVNKGIQEGAPSSTCSDVRECLREAVNVQKFNRTCERAFPLTQREIKRVYHAVKSCEVSQVADGSSPPTSTCSAAEVRGYTRVGAERPSCEDAEKVCPTPPVGTPPPAEGEPACAESQKVCPVNHYTEFWVDLTQVTESAPVDSPTPAKNNTCDTRMDSGSRFHSCAAWFGRTVDNGACSVQFTDDSGASVHGEGGQIDYSQREGCGFCTQPTEQLTCYGTPPEGAVGEVTQAEDTCSAMDLSGCAFSHGTPLRYTSDGGLVVAQRETYACEKISRQCVEWSATGSDAECTKQEAAQGTDDLASYRSSSGEALTSALVTSAQLDSVAAGQENGNSANKPGVYNGRDMRCRRPVGAVDERFTPNCCAADLARPPEGSSGEDACTLPEAELAAARRSGYAHFVGEYCSRRFNAPEDDTAPEDTSVNAGDRCIRQTQTYCVFDSVLARLVQEQGRPQLESLAASSPTANVQKATLRFSYLDNEPANAADKPGTWSPAVTANGVTLHAYQWPHYCATTEGAMKNRANSPDAPDCPATVALWLAACDLPGGACGALPADPSDGALHWKISAVDPLQHATHAVSKLAVVTGACDPANNGCEYELAAWPAGKGGRATVTRDLRWTLFATQAPSAANPPAAVSTSSAVGDMMFRGHPAAASAGAGLPPTVRLDLSRDGGATWHSYTVRTNQPAAQQHLQDDIYVSGHCDVAKNACEFRAVGTTAVSAKPWGPAIGPDCSGFTAGQLAVLDFSKMDLDEWTSTVLRENGRSVDTEASRQNGKAEAQAVKTNYENNRVEAASPTSGNFARIVPAEGFGPFTATLQVSGYWPEVTGVPERDVDKVESVTVNWGDCSDPQTLSPSSTGVGFEANHLYQVPNADAHSCLGGNLERNLTHKVTLNVRTSRTGAHAPTLKVVNVWSSYGGNNQNNAIENETLTSKPAGK